MTAWWEVVLVLLLLIFVMVSTLLLCSEVKVLLSVEWRWAVGAVPMDMLLLLISTATRIELDWIMG